MHQNAYSPKGQKKCQKMPKNVKKIQKITNNCKISEITKYGEKLTTIYKNGPKTAKNGQISKLIFHRFSGSKLPQKMVLDVFTQSLVPEIHIFGRFWLKSAFLGLNSSRTKEITAKPMVLSYVGHFCKH